MRHLILLTLVLLTACAHERVAERACPLKRLPVDVGAVPTDASYGRAVASALAAPRIGVEDPAVPEHLVLSGGGKWGSFGAGFLHAWPDRPRFRVVTGVSTGALQSTFAFLGDEAVAADREYPADLDLALPAGAPKPGEGRRYIDDLPHAYTVTRSETVLTRLGGEVTALRKGAAADLAPLRVRLNTLIDATTMARVARAAAERRALFVGVVDLDDGRAYAVDMTDLAVRASQAPPARAEQLRQCYIDVLLAASSEPLAAFPVFIAAEGAEGPFATRMYMDAGIRAGVFLEEILNDDGTPRLEGAPAPRFNTSIIVNGDLNAEDLTAAPEGKWSRKWTLLTLLDRTKTMLVDQIYQFSVKRVGDAGRRNGAMRIATARGYEQATFNGKTCEAWRIAEKKLGFPPTFMRCLIAHGRTRGTGPTWDMTSTAQTGGADVAAASAGSVGHLRRVGLVPEFEDDSRR